MPLIDIAIRSAKPADKLQRLFDGNGLYLEVSPSGGKWWRLKYRIDGKEKRLSVGVYPDVSLRAAREKCWTLRKQISAGIDPALVRRTAKIMARRAADNTFKAVSREWHLKFLPTWNTKHAENILTHLAACSPGHTFRVHNRHCECRQSADTPSMRRLRQALPTVLHRAEDIPLCRG
ncbi:Arm DNA-binding domain-containing protein [Ralstonia sp. R-29]|uniref:Arm DNA-binding domain-containing protein n=1 Tax=Ralstonia sp. R-29 TaxID=3404059 RepID=UPI003CEB4067